MLFWGLDEEDEIGTVGAPVMVEGCLLKELVWVVAVRIRRRSLASRVLQELLESASSSCGRCIAEFGCTRGFPVSRRLLS